MIGLLTLGQTRVRDFIHPVATRFMERVEVNLCSNAGETVKPAVRETIDWK